jgi:hypothetical protein
MAGNNVSQVSLAVNWRDPDFIADQSRLDLFQLTLLTPFRGVAGMQWETLAGPEDGSVAKRAAWGKGVDEWRVAQRARLGLNEPGLPYDDPRLNWTRQNFVSPQVMLHDRYLYDRATNSWTVPRFLQDVQLRYGGVDSVLLWHSYPNIGADDRSQFDMLRSMPGGVPGVKKLVEELHAHGVKVLFPCKVKGFCTPQISQICE